MAVFVIAMLAGTAPAEATWSIVAVDPGTGEVGLAAATCGPGVHFIAGSVPGTGVVAAQAATSFKGRDQAVTWIKAGVDAHEILRRRAAPRFYDGWFDADFSDLQYAVATLPGGARAGYVEGDNLDPWSGGIASADWSVQGNTLRNSDVVAGAADAIATTLEGGCQPTLAERLLNALEAGPDAGGDKRCPVATPAYSAVLLVEGPGLDATDKPADTIRLIVPRQIGLARGIYYALFPYEPDEVTPKPVQHLRDAYAASGGR